ncbi:MAG: DUF1836 domain-containing protein [Clostridia bacterium]|nr:DUF1836 domain-containing protein [Clostridia bacterium]
MRGKTVPGTEMPYTDIKGGMFSLFRPMIEAADGLTLGQVCAITSLEFSTVQNWVKRGYVDHPVRKKYYERHMARILIISAMRDSMQIERIAELLSVVNGSVFDESDDIIPEGKLYDYLCEIVRLLDHRNLAEDETYRIICDVTSDYVGPTEDSSCRLIKALTVMVYAYISGQLRREAEMYFAELKEGN